ncbi:N-acetyltransferase-like protein [Apodospora peruviana]|uniref:N-acetyltransferase-like protein n=1 Tax=Apodospora peruviana TaxID=516989 RepID=A0AAE0IRY0_9PEZI|nr:N-acetyltransferase-like protein [Apodospora peruviana]
MASATTEHRIRVRDATEADVPAMVDIHFDAFGADVMGQLLNPGGVSEDAKQKLGAGFTPPFEETVEKGKILLKVAEIIPGDAADDDKTPGEVVAFAKWVLFRRPRTEEQWNVKQTFTEEMLGKGTNIEVYSDFIERLHDERRQLAKGNPVLLLNILAVTTHRQRLGAGSELLRQGLKIADELGLPSNLESSPMGYLLYKRFGFEDVSVVDLEVTKRWGPVKPEGAHWGEKNGISVGGPLPEGYFRTVVMSRPPRSTTTA